MAITIGGRVGDVPAGEDVGLRVGADAGAKVDAVQVAAEQSYAREVARLSILTGACERQLALIAVLAKIAMPVVCKGREMLAFNHGVAPLLDPPLTLHATVHVFDVAV